MSFLTKLFASSPSNILAAVKEGDLERLKTLLKRNPELVFDGDDTGWTPLHYAVHWGRKDAAELLLANKAEVNAQADDGLTPLHCAVAQTYKNVVVELLLANKAEVNVKADDGLTPLHFAVDEGKKEMVELLLSSNAEVNAEDKGGKTPLQWAVSKGHTDIAGLLRQHGGHE